MQAAVRFYSGGGLPSRELHDHLVCDRRALPAPREIAPIGYPSIGEHSDQLGKQRCRAADARAELPRIMGEQLKRQCRASPRCLYRLRHRSLLPTTDSMRWFGIRNTVVHRNRTAILGVRLRARGTWPMSRLALISVWQRLQHELADRRGRAQLWSDGLCCFGLQALSLGRVETHALSGNWDRVPSARSAVPRTGNSCCGRRSRLWVRNQFQPPRTTTNEDRDR